MAVEETPVNKSRVFLKLESIALMSEDYNRRQFQFPTIRMDNDEPLYFCIKVETITIDGKEVIADVEAFTSAIKALERKLGLLKLANVTMTQEGPTIDPRNL